MRFKGTVRGWMAIALLVSLAPVRAQVGKGLIDPNTADEKTLLGVPHLTAPMVKGLIEKRPFASQTDFNTFLTSQGLNKTQLADTYGKTFVHLNLNTATRDEILMVPNLGNRMAHEFEEYRPYKAMAQFRREMKKYVDDKEVAQARTVRVRTHQSEHRHRRGHPLHSRPWKTHAARVQRISPLQEHGAIPSRDRQVHGQERGRASRALRHDRLTMIAAHVFFGNVRSTGALFAQTRIVAVVASSWSSSKW